MAVIASIESQPQAFNKLKEQIFQKVSTLSEHIERLASVDPDIKKALLEVSKKYKGLDLELLGLDSDTIISDSKRTDSQFRDLFSTIYSEKFTELQDRAERIAYPNYDNSDDSSSYYW